MAKKAEKTTEKAKAKTVKPKAKAAQPKEKAVKTKAKTAAAKEKTVKTKAAKPKAVKPKEKVLKAKGKAVETKAKVLKAKEKTVKTKTVKTNEKAGVKVLDLFDAYSQDMLPKDQAYVVSSFINGNTGYSIFEVVSYAKVKAIYPEGDGLTFQSSGKKLHILLEPASYQLKATEPYLRDKLEQIPLRFKELDCQTTKNQTRIYMAKKPIESLSSFTVARPVGLNISFLFYDLPDLYDTLLKFFERSFKDNAIPVADAKKAAKNAVGIIQDLMNFKGDFASM